MTLLSNYDGLASGKALKKTIGSRVQHKCVTLKSFMVTKSTLLPSFFPDYARLFQLECFCQFNIKYCLCFSFFDLGNKHVLFFIINETKSVLSFVSLSICGKCEKNFVWLTNFYWILFLCHGYTIGFRLNVEWIWVSIINQKTTAVNIKSIRQFSKTNSEIRRE